MRSGTRPPPPRPVAIDVAAAILVFGGLFGFSQLAMGEYVVTGSLPAKDPILGVAFIAYALSIALGVAIRIGRAWLPAVNFAVVVALVYLPAATRPVVLLLALAYAAAAVVLIRFRLWFSDVAAWRRATLEGAAERRLSRGRGRPPT